MGINLDKPERWKEDIARSVDQYNRWFLKFAPKTYREERVKATEYVAAMLGRTNHLRSLTLKELTEHPSILFALRMSTAPPIARDRLVGLAGVPKLLVNTMEKDGRLPRIMTKVVLNENLRKIARMIVRLTDVDIFPCSVKLAILPSRKSIELQPSLRNGSAERTPSLLFATLKNGDSYSRSRSGLKREATRT